MHIHLIGESQTTCLHLTSTADDSAPRQAFPILLHPTEPSLLLTALLQGQPLHEIPFMKYKDSFLFSSTAQHHFMHLVHIHCLIFIYCLHVCHYNLISILPNAVYSTFNIQSLLTKFNYFSLDMMPLYLQICYRCIYYRKAVKYTLFLFSINMKNLIQVTDHHWAQLSNFKTYL